MNQSKMWINPREKKSKQFKINKMNFNVKQTFLKKLSRKIWRFSMLVVENNYPVYNYMFKIDIKSTRTRWKICSKLTIKTAGIFFYCWLWICTCLLDSYLNFYCLDDFHYLGCFHCLHDLQKNWNLVYILKLV